MNYCWKRGLQFAAARGSSVEAKNKNSNAEDFRTFLGKQPW